MRILFFNSLGIGQKADVFEMGNVFPRVGIASIAAYLLSYGQDVKIMDPAVQMLNLNQIKDEVRKFKPAIVGLPAYTEEIHQAADIARVVKDVDPEVVTVIGGPHASADPVQVLREFISFDVAVYGEGEQTLLDLTTGRPVEEILGIGFRDGDETKLNKPRPLIKDLNTLPFPAWHLYDLDKYRGNSLYYGFKKAGKKLLELPIEGGRGCPYSCIFCFRTIGRTVRFKSPSVIVDEIERNVKEFQADAIYFVEGTFGVNKNHDFTVCEEIIRRGLQERIVWSCGARVDIEKELLMKMKEAGCFFIGFGVESGNSEILKIIGKNIQPKQSIETLKTCKKIGIKTEANFILGHPYETEETVKETIALAKKLDADHANFAILVPFPGTEVYKMGCKNIGGLKIKTTDWKLYGKQLGAALEHENLPTHRLVQLQAQAYRAFYLQPSKVSSFIKERISLKLLFHSLKRVLKSYLR